MAVVINGNGTVTGISVGGLPDGIVDAGTLATNSVDSAELIDGSIDNSHIDALAASKLTGALPAISGASLTNVGGLQSQQVFTSSGTWTKPSGINTIKVYVTGGGGGGGGPDQTWTNKVTAGGGAAGTAIEIIDVSAISSETVTIGSGGAGNYGTGGGVGTGGGTSSFGSHCSATGGGGSDRATSGGAGLGVGGDINMYGGRGGRRDSGDSNWDYGGEGGHAFFGRGAAHNGNGRMGGGGRGSCAKNSHADDATDGGDGIVIVEEYS